MFGKLLTSDMTKKKGRVNEKRPEPRAFLKMAVADVLSGKGIAVGQAAKVVPGSGGLRGGTFFLRQLLTEWCPKDVFQARQGSAARSQTVVLPTLQVGRSEQWKRTGGVATLSPRLPFEIPSRWIGFEVR